MAARAAQRTNRASTRSSSPWGETLPGGSSRGRVTPHGSIHGRRVAFPSMNNESTRGLRRDGSSHRSEQAATPALRFYLNEVAVTHLLDQAGELELASRFKKSRIAIAALAQALPRSCRKHVLLG